MSQTACTLAFALRVDAESGFSSGGCSEDSFYETHLSCCIAFREPADLTLTNDVHCLVSCDGAQGSRRRPEPLTRGDPLLHKAVILFNDVVQIR